jgi:hypothetical protein
MSDPRAGDLRSHARVAIRRWTDASLEHPNVVLGVLLALALLLARLALAGDQPYVYPAAGQSDSQVADDRYACHRDAVDRSGFDPVNAALKPPVRAEKVVVPVPKNEAGGSTAKGMLTGAVAGGVIGAATDNHPGEIAVAGAVLGTIIGGAIESEGARKAEDQAKAEADAKMRDQQSRIAALDSRQEAYRRAFTACMEARHYSVR